jgi:hypothetical protein
MRAVFLSNSNDPRQTAATSQRSFQLRSFSGRPGPNTTGRSTAGIKRVFSQTRLRGWACMVRTGESDPELIDWNCVTTWPEVGEIRTGETPGVHNTELTNIEMLSPGLP